MRRGSAPRLALVAALVIAWIPIGSSHAAAATCGNPAAPTTTIYLPNITKTLGGPSGWVTPFIVQNVGVANTDLEVSFFRFIDGSLVTCRVVSALAPGTSFADFPNADVDLPGDTQFSVVVKSFGAKAVSVVNEHQGLGTPARAEALSYVGLSSGATKAYIPYAAKQFNGWLTTMVVQNLGTSAANVTATFTSYDGTRTATLTRQIVPGRSAAIDPTVEPLLLGGTEYAGVLSADQPIAAIVNAHNDTPAVAAPMGFSYNAVAQPLPVATYVPAISRNADAVGRTTRILVENAGGSNATPTLTFRAPSGALVTVSSPVSVRPGATWSYDPRFFADGRTPCPPTGAPTCPAEGTHALTVQGGAFAVVAASLTATSAMGVIGSSAQGNRAYLPNVTRTLGGAQGWTTPIVIESAGATGATLRWYRFSDGVLVTRQTLSGLVQGGSVTIDPRTVTGLADDTQYAVVVDASNGNIVAIVTELNFQGGDGDMGYEGFAAAVNPFPEPTVITVAPTTASVVAGGTAQFVATVKDQFDNVMTTAPVTWSVTPSTLGTIASNGLFTAGQTGGSGAITARAGTASATAAVTVSASDVRTVGGITFVFVASGGADMFVESAIIATERTTLTTAAAADVVQVQTDFGRGFTRRPQIYAFATTASFTTGMQTVFGASATEAQSIGQAATGIWTDFTPVGEAIGVDWQKMRNNLPVTAMRHELTHWMVDQIVPAEFVPTWFNEGSARSEEFTVTGSQHNVIYNKYGAASMAANGLLFSLADMTDPFVWGSRPGLAGIYQYYAAQQAVQFIRGDFGTSATARVLDAMRTGQPFETAYQTVTGQTFATFSAAYAGRVRALSPAYPGIATAQDTRLGPGMSIEIYGFTPNTTISITITGAASSVPTSRAVDQYGVLSTFLDNTWPNGTYTITATSSSQSATITAAKSSSSFGIAALDAGETGPLELPEDVASTGE